MTMLVKMIISNKKIDQVSFLPAIVNKAGQSELLTRDDTRSDETCEYVQWACRDQNLNTTFDKRGNEVIVVN
jgi:hypothetical protein